MTPEAQAALLSAGLPAHQLQQPKARKPRPALTFNLSRTEQGRWQATCNRCHATQASWTPSLVSRWQQTHAGQSCS